MHGIALMLSRRVDPTDDGDIHLSIVAAKALQAAREADTKREALESAEQQKKMTLLTNMEQADITRQS